MSKLGQSSAAADEERDQNNSPPDDSECSFKYCRTMKECGHKCMGVHGESECLPCLMPSCVHESAEADFLPTNEELCSICYTSELREEPCV